MRVKTYDKEFIKNAIELYKNGKPGMHICKDLGISTSTFWGWLKQDKVEGIESFTGSGNIKPANQEMTETQKRA